MKRFFLKFFAYLLALLLPCAAYFFYQQQFPAVYNNTFMGTVPVKLRLLREISSPKVVILSGSSGPYAIEAETMDRALGMPCFVDGSVAAIGMEFCLSLAEDAIGAGDIVIVEPEFLMWSGERSNQIDWCCLQNHYEVYRYVPLSYWPDMICHYYDYVQQRNMSFRRDTPEEDLVECYYDQDLGPRGDLLVERYAVMEDGYLTSALMDVSPELLDMDCMRALNRFVRKMQRRGATVYVHFAPFARAAVTTTPEEVAAFEQKVIDTCDATVISRLEDCLVDNRYLHSTNNHLNSEGAHMFTRLVLQDLAGAGVPVDWDALDADAK